MRYVLLACLVLCAGCAAFTDYAESPTRGPDGRPVWRPEDVVWRDQLDRSPLHMEVSVAPAVVDWGDTVVITARLVNDLDRPVGVRYGTGCTSSYALWRGDTRVFAPEQACTMATVTRIYPPGPGQPGTITWVWRDRRIGAGDYRFTVGLGADGSMDAGDAPLVLRRR